MEREVYCAKCGMDINEKSEKSLINNFPPCEVCGKVFELKVFDLCSTTCRLKFFDDFSSENIFQCSSCKNNVCLCQCRWYHFNDKNSCECNSCVNNYDELMCENCNMLKK